MQEESKMIAHIHPDNPAKEQTVQEHLEETANLAKQIGIPLGMGNLAYITASFHDLGKFRNIFKQYLTEAVSSGNKKARGSVNHSSAGAIYIYQKYYKGDFIHKLTAQLICEAILSHHGLNDCLSVEGEDCFRKRVENLEGLDYEEVIENLNNSTLPLEHMDEIFTKAVQEVALLQQSISDHRLSKYFTNGLIERMLLSILIDADRLNTAVFCGDRSSDEGSEDALVPWDILQSNLEHKLEEFTAKDGIFKLRQDISNECYEFAVRPPGIYRLAVPTGGGKTLSSMRYAIRHAKQYEKKRIFYISPYLSILEQNSQVFREVIKNDDLMLEHHSNVIPEEDDTEGYEQQNRYRHLTENWDSTIVITTFVQFLNTLFAGKTSSVRRFHNLSDSVILIDEIQSLPINMISIFNMTMNYLSHMCKATVILCSATQPILDKVLPAIHMTEPVDIISDTDGLYKALKRVRIEEKKGIFKTEGLCEFVAGLTKVHKSILIILNTKKAVRTLYQELSKQMEETGEKITILQLSTNMCPEHRLTCIERVKKETKEERVICISTSLIEAGVDVSFSCVLRSYAGLDSIAQAAGRCNRNAEEEEGVVYLIRYEEERLGRLLQTRIGAACSESVVELFQKDIDRFNKDLLSIPALYAFYERYYHDREQKQEMQYPLKKSGANLVDLLGDNLVSKKAFFEKTQITEEPDLALRQAFKTAGEHFSVIDQDTTGILVPYGEGVEIINSLNGDLPGKEISKWLRKGQRFTVNLYKNQIQELNKAGALVTLKNGQVLALKDGFYDAILGIVTEGNSEFLLIDY
jgi:CRISPR-associated endonuclease/helicase Cas3